jgi:hypothetical protein
MKKRDKYDDEFDSERQDTDVEDMGEFLHDEHEEAQVQQVLALSEAEFLAQQQADQ